MLASRRLVKMIGSDGCGSERMKVEKSRHAEEEYDDALMEVEYFFLYSNDDDLLGCVLWLRNLHLETEATMVRGSSFGANWMEDFSTSSYHEELSCRALLRGPS